LREGPQVRLGLVAYGAHRETRHYPVLT
jgi:hypothetical protein